MIPARALIFALAGVISCGVEPYVVTSATTSTTGDDPNEEDWPIEDPGEEEDTGEEDWGEEEEEDPGEEDPDEDDDETSDSGETGSNSDDYGAPGEPESSGADGECPEDGLCETTGDREPTTGAKDSDDGSSGGVDDILGNA